MSLIDFGIAIIGAIVGGFIIMAGFGLYLLIRALVRWVCGNDDDTVSGVAPRVRTRIQHSPIETEIADAIAREIPPHTRSKFKRAN